MYIVGTGCITVFKPGFMYFFLQNTIWLFFIITNDKQKYELIFRECYDLPYPLCFNKYLKKNSYLWIIYSNKFIQWKGKLLKITEHYKLSNSTIY